MVCINLDFVTAGALITIGNYSHLWEEVPQKNKTKTPSINTKKHQNIKCLIIINTHKMQDQTVNNSRSVQSYTSTNDLDYNNYDTIINYLQKKILTNEFSIQYDSSFKFYISQSQLYITNKYNMQKTLKPIYMQFKNLTQAILQMSNGVNTEFIQNNIKNNTIHDIESLNNVKKTEIDTFFNSRVVHTQADIINLMKVISVLYEDIIPYIKPIKNNNEAIDAIRLIHNAPQPPPPPLQPPPHQALSTQFPFSVYKLIDVDPSESTHNKYEWINKTRNSNYIRNLQYN